MGLFDPTMGRSKTSHNGRLLHEVEDRWTRGRLVFWAPGGHYGDFHGEFHGDFMEISWRFHGQMMMKRDETLNGEWWIWGKQLARISGSKSWQPGSKVKLDSSRVTRTNGRTVTCDLSSQECVGTGKIDRTSIYEHPECSCFDMFCLI